MAEIDCRNLSKSRGVFGLMASKTATEYLEGHSAVTHYFVSLFSYAPIMSLREAQKKVVVVFSFFFSSTSFVRITFMRWPTTVTAKQKGRDPKTLLTAKQN